MKKLLIAVLPLLFVIGISGNSSAQAFKEGDLDISTGGGIGSWLGAGFPVGLAAEYGVTHSVSVGITTGYSSYGNDYYSLMRNHNWFFGARGTFHAADLFKKCSEKLDPYAGLQVGYDRVNTEYADIYYPYGAGSFHTNKIFIGGYLGTRMMFGKHIGGFAEFGYGTFLLQLGLTTRF